jgi:hypothetical protein
MNWWQIVLLVAALLAMDVVVVSAIMVGFTQSFFSRLAKRFPAVAPGEGAIRKEFQSVRVNSANFSRCVHITIDDERIHFEPARMLRWYGGVTVSVPWSEIEAMPQTLGARRWMKCKIAGISATIPTWCVDEAAGGGPVDDSR